MILMKTTIGNSSNIIMQAHQIRHKVFVEEQQIPQELDHDGLDQVSIHALVKDGESLIATARLFPANSQHAILARVAVLKEYRGKGIAAEVIKALLSYAQQSGFSSIEIHAHEYLQQYYKKFGFEFIQNVEVVGEHQLIEMRLTI